MAKTFLRKQIKFSAWAITKHECSILILILLEKSLAKIWEKFRLFYKTGKDTWKTHSGSPVCELCDLVRLYAVRAQTGEPKYWSKKVRKERRKCSNFTVGAGFIGASDRRMHEYAPFKVKIGLAFSWKRPIKRGSHFISNKYQLEMTSFLYFSGGDCSCISEIFQDFNGHNFQGNLDFKTQQHFDYFLTAIHCFRTLFSY